MACNLKRYILGGKKIHINQLIRLTRSEKLAVAVAGRKGGGF